MRAPTLMRTSLSSGALGVEKAIDLERRLAKSYRLWEPKVAAGVAFEEKT